MLSHRGDITRHRHRYRYILALLGAALIAGALTVAPAPARADLTYTPLTEIPGSTGASFSHTASNIDGSIRAHLFRIPGLASNPNRHRLAILDNGTWRTHDITSETVASDGGSLAMSRDGHTIVVAYRRDNGTFATVSTDKGITWSAETTLSTGASGRAWGPHAAISGNSQHIVLSWYERVASKDTVHFVHSSDSGTSFTAPIQPAASGQTEQDVMSAISTNGATIALTWKTAGNTTWGYHSFDHGRNWVLRNLTALAEGVSGSNMPHVAVSGNG